MNLLMLVVLTLGLGSYRLYTATEEQNTVLPRPKPTHIPVTTIQEATSGVEPAEVVSSAPKHVTEPHESGDGVMRSSVPGTFTPEEVSAAEKAFQQLVSSSPVSAVLINWRRLNNLKTIVGSMKTDIWSDF